MKERIRPPAALPGLVAALRARYSDLEIVAAYLTERDDGVMQQNVEFRAPLSRLVAHGLVTAAMIENVSDGRRGRDTTPLGDGFFLAWEAGEDPMAKFGLFTGATPRERPRIALAAARRELSRIFPTQVRP